MVLTTFITIIIMVTGIVLCTISIQRRLVVLNENVSNAMSQIGVQLSSRFDALIALLDLTKGYAKHESETLMESVTKLNREIRMLLVSLIAGILGFRQREYLEEQAHGSPSFRHE
jgi:hypothetical protein